MWNVFEDVIFTETYVEETLKYTRLTTEKIEKLIYYWSWNDLCGHVGKQPASFGNRIVIDI